MGAVAEIQGLYGPIHIAERVVQKIWLRGEYLSDGLRTVNGETLTILSPGIWQPSAGPDFQGARLSIGGREVLGDVEIHLYAKDWISHGHEGDAAYDNVVLHVVLFGDKKDFEKVRTGSGHSPDTLVLLPALNHDLESYAYDDHLLEVFGKELPQWIGELCEMGMRDKYQLLMEESRARWHLKVERYKNNLERRDMAEIFHEGILEVLGYRKNRATMRLVASDYELHEWLGGNCEVERVFGRYLGRWTLSGIRPANHPRKRLNQYEQLCRLTQDWPSLLSLYLGRIPVISESIHSSSAYRRRSGMKALRTELQRSVLSGLVSGSRLDTLMVDLFLPLAAASRGVDLFEMWYHWYAGDLPQWIATALKAADLSGRKHPHCNGSGQAMLSLYLRDGV